MYVYPLIWKARFLIVYLILCPILNMLAYLLASNISMQIALEFNFLLMAVFIGNWLLVSITKPNKFVVLENGVQLHYLFKSNVTIKFDEIKSIENVSVKNTDNLFGQSELALHTEIKTYYVVSHLVNFDSFKAHVNTGVNS